MQGRKRLRSCRSAHSRWGGWLQTQTPLCTVLLASQLALLPFLLPLLRRLLSTSPPPSSSIRSWREISFIVRLSLNRNSNRCAFSRSSLVFFSPIARATTAGPAVKICAVDLDITEKCEATSRPAGKPATAPSAAVATGTVAIASAMERNLAGPFTGSGKFDPLLSVRPTLPPDPSCSRTSGSLY